METTQDEIFTPCLISDMVAMFHRSHHQIVIEQNCGEKIVCFVLTIYLDGNRVWSSDYDITNVDTSINQKVYDFNDIPPHIFGDKVEVVNPTTAKALSLAEVQVLTVINIQQPIHSIRFTESCKWWRRLETKPDGSGGREIVPIPVSATNWETSPYWHVLLGSPVVIGSVVIHNREDLPCDGGLCSERLHGFKMEILLVVDGNKSTVSSPTITTLVFKIPDLSYLFTYHLILWEIRSRSAFKVNLN